jgi:hypothetical protein
MKTRRTFAVLAAMACTLVLGAAPSAAHTTAPYCGITWGSLAKASSPMTGAPIVGARVGKHACYDRLVLDLGGKPAGGYEVRYLDGLYNEDTGERVPVAGGAVLMVTARAPIQGDWRWATPIMMPREFTSGEFRTFRALVFAGSYEGQTDIALGVRSRLPFRVFTLDGPSDGSRLVIDVAHKW